MWFGPDELRHIYPYQFEAKTNVNVESRRDLPKSVSCIGIAATQHRTVRDDKVVENVINNNV